MSAVARLVMTCACGLLAGQSVLAADFDGVFRTRGEIAFPLMPGHPVVTDPKGAIPDAFRDMLTLNAPSIPIPVVWPVASGSFVNYETFPFKGLALSPDAATLYAVNTPNASLAVIDVPADGDLPRIAREIRVGLDPVSVAVQPGTGGQFVWVVNYISDDVSVIDMDSEQVVAVIPVGNEPTVILFDASGGHAYVVLQSTPPGADTSNTLPHLVTIDTATRQVVHQLELEMNNTRAAAIDVAGQRLYVAAQDSGNNTTLAGIPVALRFTTDPNEIPVFDYSLRMLQQFSLTSALFNGSSLGPYPDPAAEPNPPLVPRIVPDAGVAGTAWQQLMDVLTLPDGSIDPAVLTQWESEFGITNGQHVLEEIAHDVKDTVDHDIAIIDLASPAAPQVSGYIGEIGTTLTGMAYDPAGDRLLIANTEALNELRTVTQLRGRSVDHRVTIVDDPAGAATVTVTDLHSGLAAFNLPVPTDAWGSLALPQDIVLSSDASRAFVAAFGPGRIGVLRGGDAAVNERLDVGEGARSLCLDEANQRLFVLNRGELSVTMVDVAVRPAVVLRKLFLFNPEPAIVKQGRKFANATDFSPNNATSCHTCHTDMHHDHLSWDLGEPNQGLLPVPSNVVGSNHPMKGPMFTLSLRGLKDHNKFHWRGDKPALQDFNGTFSLLFGGQQLPQDQIDAMAGYIESIEYAPSPHYTRTNQLESESALTGAVLFISACGPCHSLFEDGTLKNANGEDDAGGNFESIFAQIQEITQLRQIEKKYNSDVYTGFGLVHDGRETREEPVPELSPHVDHPLHTFLKTFFPAFDPNERGQIIEFMTAYPTNSLPVVGWQVRVTGPGQAQQVADINTMIAQSLLTPSQNDVVAQGTLGGTPIGLVLVAEDPNDPIEFQSDTFELFTLNDLLNSLSDADALVFSAVPPGSGNRIGVDWDQDCIPNGLDAYPLGTADLNGDTQVNLTDLAEVLARFGQEQVRREDGDVTGDGRVGLSDLAEVLAAFGQTTCADPPD